MSEAELSILLLSVRVAVACVLLSLVPAVGVAWLLARWQSRWRGVVHGVVLLPLVLPPVVTGYVLLHTLGRGSALGAAWHALTGGHLSFTTSACVIAAAVVGFPLFVESTRLAILGVDPELEHVSRSLGRGRWSTFATVTLPLAWPGVAAGGVLCFARALGEFGATIVLAGDIPGETRTIPVAVYVLQNTPRGDAAVLRLVAASVALALAALLVATWWNRRARSGVI